MSLHKSPEGGNFLRFKVAINNSIVNKLPNNASKVEWRQFNGAFANKNLTLDEMVNAIRQGFAYTTHHKRYRKAGNFMCGQHIAIDFDTEDEQSSFAYLLRDEIISEHAAFLHTTPSHTSAAPRTRAVFFLDRPIKSAEKYSLLAQAFVNHYQIADEKCKDVCRLFYGSLNCDVHMLGNVMTLEDAGKLIVEPYKTKLREEAETEEHRTLEIESHRFASPPPKDSHIERYVDNITEIEFSLLSGMTEGSRHSALLESAIKLGSLLKSSWVPSSIFDEYRVYSMLEHACRKNGLWTEDGESDIKRTIADGIDYAVARIEPAWGANDMPKSMILPEIELTDDQAKRERQAIERIRAEAWWEGFHAGMEAGHRALWEHLVGADAVDIYKLGYSHEKKALTIPYFDAAGILTNLEYIHLDDWAYSYESETTLPLFMARRASSNLCLMFEDPLTAMYVATFAQTLLEHTLAGLPHKSFNANTFAEIDGQECIAFHGPDIERTKKELLGRRAKLIELTLPVKDMLESGLTEKDLQWYIRQVA